LLFGRFDYQQFGLLDRTHLRFFTLKTTRQLLEEAGYMIVHLDARYVMPAGTHFVEVEGNLGRFIKRHFIGLFGFQFIVKAVQKTGRDGLARDCHLNQLEGNTCGPPGGGGR
jgi:hypothetical protein